MKKIISIVCCGLLLCSLNGLARTKVLTQPVAVDWKTFTFPPFSLLVLSSPNSNGSYPRWSSVDVIFYFDDNTLPVGVKYEFKVVQPNGLVNYYPPKASHKIAVSLDAAGSYEVYGRMVGSAGATSVWESITLLSAN